MTSHTQFNRNCMNERAKSRFEVVVTSYDRNKNRDDEIKKQEKENNNPSYRCEAINDEKLCNGTCSVIGGCKTYWGTKGKDLNRKILDPNKPIFVFGSLVKFSIEILQSKISVNVEFQINRNCSSRLRGSGNFVMNFCSQK